MTRIVLTPQNLRTAASTVEMYVKKRFQKHGNRSYVSTHEMLGLLTEEYHELVEAVRMNRMEGVKSEIADIAVICLIALASIDRDAMDL